MRIQFICKKGQIYNVFQYCRRSSGLYNSTSFIVQSLQARGIDAELIEVHDNNDIDREVTRFKPDAVVLEAVWVVPDKFDILKRLHPRVQWFVHLHSQMPFLSLESMAFGWLIDSVAKGVKMIANSPESYYSLRSILSHEDITYLPNVYIREQHRPKRSDSSQEFIDIACFGAVRPLKNHMIQALAAIQFAKDQRQRLRFHINGTRLEMGGGTVLKSLRDTFARLPEHQLVESHWREPEEFLNFLRTLDFGMQVSLSETFNVVSADYVSSGLPIVVSKEVPWASTFNKASDADPKDIVRVMHRAYNNPMLTRLNQWLLTRYSHIAQHMWYDWAKEL